MTSSRLRQPRREPPPVADDTVLAPPPVDEMPPSGRFCDLVLTGGVASGVVYPWAVVELARSYHFKNIGGTSVGAMAAALTAAAEYGRRNGYANAFEPLRRTPEQLAEELHGGRTRMLSLFQAEPAGRRLLALFSLFVAREADAKVGPAGRLWRRLRRVEGAESRPVGPIGPLRRSGRKLRGAARIYRAELLRGTLLGFVAAAALLVAWMSGTDAWPPPRGELSLLASASAVVWLLVFGLGGAAFCLLCALLRELRLGLVDNGYGLCPGACTDPAGPVERPGLTDWLHEGIQRSAGLRPDDAPLTFRDLWRAPLEPGAAERGADAVGQRAIDLQMVTTSVTHMRPYRLPLKDPAGRLFFRRSELEQLFPVAVLDAMVQASRKYTPQSLADPAPAAGVDDLYALPYGGLPIVVAARMSLSFPLLFSAVPMHAIDFEGPSGARRIEKCWFTDGGLCANFPIHLFDSMLPRCPTFGIWLDKRSWYHEREAVWLPETWDEGKGDTWHRFDRDKPDATAPPPDSSPGSGGCIANFLRSRVCVRQVGQRCAWLRLGGFLWASALAAKDWNDRLAMRMPQTRHRVARLFLRPGEGELNIAMTRTVILRMAREYGTPTGRLFVDRYAGDPGAQGSASWVQQRWVRVLVLMSALRRLLRGFGESTAGTAYAAPLDAMIRRAESGELRQGVKRADEVRLTDDEAQAIQRFVSAARELELALSGVDASGRFKLDPDPEMRLRPPV